MLRRKVRGYDSFRCIAGDCPQTCCAGWLIEIDDEALEGYQKETSAYGETLRARIDWEEKVFRQDADARCAFLRQDGLCDMYCHLGEDSLCQGIVACYFLSGSGGAAFSDHSAAFLGDLGR